MRFSVKFTNLRLWEKEIVAKTKEQAIEIARRQSNSWEKKRWVWGDECQSPEVEEVN